MGKNAHMHQYNYKTQTCLVYTEHLMEAFEINLVVVAICLSSFYYFGTSNTNSNYCMQTFSNNYFIAQTCMCNNNSYYRIFLYHLKFKLYLYWQILLKLQFMVIACFISDVVAYTLMAHMFEDVSLQCNMWLSLQKPSMLACKFWPIFQCLKSNNSVIAK